MTAGKRRAIETDERARCVTEAENIGDPGDALLFGMEAVGRGDDEEDDGDGDILAPGGGGAIAEAQAEMN